MGHYGGTARAACVTTALKLTGKSAPASNQNDRNEISKFSARPPPKKKNYCVAILSILQMFPYIIEIL